MSVTDLNEMIGPAHSTAYVHEKGMQVGVATGLAYDNAGGSIMFIESTLTSLPTSQSTVLEKGT